MVRSDFYHFASAVILVFCTATHATSTNIHNAQSCCEWLASADIDWCTASECTTNMAGPGMGRSGPGALFDSQIMQIQPFFGAISAIQPPLFTNLDTWPPLFTNPASAPAIKGVFMRGQL